MVRFDEQSWMLSDKDGSSHKLWSQVLWYLAPALTVPDPSTHPLHLAMTLHNAKLGQGIAPALSVLLKDLPPRTGKTGTAGVAEDLFETVRIREFPHRPSRLRSYFLSLDRASAEERAKTWGWDKRKLVRCYLILSGAKYHYADVRDYEGAARRGATEADARSYWADYDPQRVPVEVTEVLADSALFFPDWRAFPTIDFAATARLNTARLAR